MPVDPKAEQLFASAFGRAPRSAKERQFIESTSQRKQGPELLGAFQFARQEGKFTGTQEPAPTNPQQQQQEEGAGGVGESLLGSAKSLQSAYQEIQKERENVRKQKEKLIETEMRNNIQQSILADPQFQEYQEFLAQKRGQVQTQDFSVDGTPGITDPEQTARLSRQQRGDLATQATQLAQGLQDRRQFVSQQVSDISSLRQEDFQRAQQEFENARTTFSDLLSLREDQRAEAAQNVELSGLTAQQRGEMVNDLVEQGYTAEDAITIVDRYSGGFTPGSSGMRTDRHNNPAAFTTDVAKQAGLVEGVDYEVGDPFPNNPNQHTARLLKDPVNTTIRVIDRLGFKTQGGQNRWKYTDSIPGANNAEWSNLSREEKERVITEMYKREGGSGELVGEGSDLGAIEARRQANLQEVDTEDRRERINANTGVLNAGTTVLRDSQTALGIMESSAPFQVKGTAAATTRVGLSKIPGTKPYEVDQLIESVKSNVGIDALLRIKASGAGLGQVPQSQLETLQSVLGRLDIGRDPELLARDLRHVMNLYQQITNEARQELESLGVDTELDDPEATHNPDDVKNTYNVNY